MFSAGKTELCKTLAETYFGSEKDMIRIDMSEYMEKVNGMKGDGFIWIEEFEFSSFFVPSLSQTAFRGTANRATTRLHWLRK